MIIDRRHLTSEALSWALNSTITTGSGIAVFDVLGTRRFVGQQVSGQQVSGLSDVVRGSKVAIFVVGIQEHFLLLVSNHNGLLRAPSYSLPKMFVLDSLRGKKDVITLGQEQLQGTSHDINDLAMCIGRIFPDNGNHATPSYWHCPQQTNNQECGWHVVRSCTIIDGCLQHDPPAFIDFHDEGRYASVNVLRLEMFKRATSLSRETSTHN